MKRKKKKNNSAQLNDTGHSPIASSKIMIKLLLAVLGLIISVTVVMIAVNWGDDEAPISSLTNNLIPSEPPSVAFTNNGYLHFISKNDDTLSRIEIELVNNAYERSLGLMYRDNMLDDQGMLFIFPNTEPMGFWMKNTEISLDIIFIDGAKNIVKIHKNTPPYSDSTFESIVPSKYVVETNAGYTDRHDISEGDKIVFVIETL